MKRRGRPPYPDVLTPRQQEVLALLREGLTNAQIAERLGISADGAKFHVAEIIGRLGVADREEAARWAPEAAAQRAWVVAPAALLRRVTPAWLPPAVSAGIIVAVVAGTGLLAWRVLSTRGGSGAHVVAPTPTAGTGAIARTNIPAVDATIDLLVRQNVKALLGRVQFTTVGCSVEQTVGSPPPCATGVADGTPLQAFPLGFCEGTYATTIDQVDGAFGGALSRQPNAAVYAVLRRDGTHSDGYTVAITPDVPTQATAPVSFWYLSADGKITGLQNECGAPGAAQQVAYRFPRPEFVLGPFKNCSPPPGEYANLMITVDSLSPGGVLPQFWGAAKSTLGVPTGERAIVTVTAATQWGWSGSRSRLEDVRAGDVLQAVGRRQPDCTILAETVLSEFVGTPVSGPPTSGTIVGQVVQDVDGDGKFSLPDLPGRTLIQLVSPARTLSLYTATDGTFRIVHIPDGSFMLRVWWFPGFVNLNADSANAGLASLPVSVHVKVDQAVTLTMPSTIFVKPASPDTLPFPVDEARAAGPDIPTGVLDAGAISP